MKLSIIVVNYHTLDLIKRLKKSLDSQIVNFDYEVIIQDNSDENVGFGKANNKAVEKAKGEYLLFLNPDTQLIADNCLQVLVDYLDQHQNTGALGPRLVDRDGVFQWSCDYSPSLLRMLFDKPLALIYKFNGNNRFILKLLSLFSPRYDFVNINTQIDWVSGAAMLVKRSAFNKVVGFDPHFFMFFEDADLCLRIKQAGFEVHYLPNVTVEHLVGKSFKKSIQKDNLYYQSQSLFFRIHRPKWEQKLLGILRVPYRKLGLRVCLNRY